MKPKGAVWGVFRVTDFLAPKPRGPHGRRAVMLFLDCWHTRVEKVSKLPKSRRAVCWQCSWRVAVKAWSQLDPIGNKARSRELRRRPIYYHRLRPRGS